MGTLRWGRTFRVALLVLMLGFLGRAAVGPAGAQEVTPTEPSDGVPACEIAAGDDFYTTPMNTALNVPDPGVFANDSSSATVLLFDVGSASHGMATVGSFGELNYTPDTGFAGTDSFQYTIYCINADQQQSYATGTVTITVGDDATPMPPCEIMAADDHYTTPKDTALNVPDPGVFANDTSSSDLTLFDVLPASHGMATVGSAGELNYTPDAGFVGTDSFQYKIYCMNEEDEQSYATGTVYITVGDDTVPTTTPVPSVTKTPVPAQPTAPSVSKLPVTGAGSEGTTSSFPTMAIMVSGLMIAGGLAVAGLRRGHAKR